MTVNESPTPGDADGVKVGQSEPARTKSGSHNLLSVKEGFAIAEETVKPLMRQTLAQWLVMVPLAGFITWALVTLGTLSTAQAQSNQDHETLKNHLTEDAARKVIVDTRFEKIMERLDAQDQNDRDLYNAVMYKKKSKRLGRDAGVDDE